jgi:alpha-L-fucosidase
MEQLAPSLAACSAARASLILIAYASDQYNPSTLEEAHSMKITRREALGVLAGAVPAWRSGASLHSQSPAKPEIAAGPFQPTMQSLSTYRVPDWFRDAKFGIWAHWGPQSSVEAGDWYARNMYIETEDQYKYHLAHYGHPSKFGYKDLIPLWKGAEFDPEHLMSLYKKAGARYFMSMGVHHDNFDLWNSKHNGWNAVNMGIKKDVVGLWAKVAREAGLKFGVSDHLWISYKWWAVSHLSDTHGEFKGVPYDGADPKYSSLYHQIDDPRILAVKFDWNEALIPDSWKEHWFHRIKDLIDRYHPDMLYSDGQLPFGEWGYRLLAHHYNTIGKLHGGKVEAVYTSKRREDSDAGLCILDRERGVLEEIWPHPWQTDTCIGDWHYKRGIEYKSAKTVVDMLVDIVSKNGNLMLNFPLPNSGMLDDRELKTLSGITDWMAVNSEAIHATRPWKISGQVVAPATAAADASFNESKRPALAAVDVRFTKKGQTLYAFVMGWPEKQAVIAPLSVNSKHAPGNIHLVELLGHSGKLKWTRDAAGLKIDLPGQKPCDYAITFRISGSGLV